MRRCVLCRQHVTNRQALELLGHFCCRAKISQGILHCCVAKAENFLGLIVKKPTPTADGDKAEFIFRISATIVNGKVSYTFKR